MDPNDATVLNKEHRNAGNGLSYVLHVNNSG